MGTSTRIRAAVLLVLLGIAVFGVALATGRARSLAASTPAAASTTRGFFGRVTDKARKPVVGARVDTLWIAEDDAPRVLASASVRPDGAFVVEVAPPPGARGVLVLRASAGGFASAGRRVEEEARQQDFVLEREAMRVSLVATSDDGPVAGAEAMIAFEPTIAEPGALTLFSGATDREGRFTVEGLSQASGKIHFTAVKRGRGRANGTLPKPAGSTPIDIDARIEEGARIVGDIRDVEGRAVTGATVHASETDGPWGDDAASDAEGRFALRGVPAGGIVVQMRGDWVLASSEQIPVTLARSEREKTIHLVAQRAGRIEGRVVGPDGAPVPSATVDLAPAGSAVASPRRTATDDGGHFTVVGLRSDLTWDVEARHPDRAPGFLPRVATGANVEIVLAEGGAIAGEIVDGSGAGHAGVEIYAHRIEARADGKTVIGLREHESVKSNERGAYRLGHLVAGTYRVEVRSPTRMAWAPTAAKVLEAVVVEGKESRMDRVTIERGGRVVGSIRSAGPSLPRVLTVSLLPSGQNGSPHQLNVHVARDGGFVVGPIDPGRYAIHAHGVDRGYSRPADVTVSAGKDASVVLDLAGSATLAGVVVDARGEPVSDARIEVYAPDAGSQKQHSLPGRAPDNFTGGSSRSAADGTFTVRGLEPGRYAVRVEKAGMPPIVDQLVVVEDAARPVRLALPAPARIEVAVAGPAPASRVVLIESEGGRSFSSSGVTDDKGVVRFEGLPPATYRLRAIAGGMKESSVGVLAGESKRVVLTGG
ncbi:MAG: carboxypeptidase regulatory-like domain-containing protein [Deltaproteobacteria bacterium]|nr:carboxypeptidase regulatory-like domain-containing protein [Deltaproteobacteria bacterium]